MKYNVSCDLRVPVLVEIEAESEEDAVDKLYEMERNELLKLADTSNDAMEIVGEVAWAQEEVQ